MTSVVPVAPFVTGDVLFIPPMTGVIYEIDGNAVSTMSINFTENVTVTAVPAATYTFPDGSATAWAFVYAPPVDSSDDPFTVSDNDAELATLVAKEDSAVNAAVEAEIVEALEAFIKEITVDTVVDTVAKVGALPGGPVAGDIYALKFTAGNSAASPTLDLGANGAKPFHRVGAVVTSLAITANGTVLVYFTGTAYVILG